jgi:hypothetical protein
MWILTLVLFLVFFGLLVPAFLYWFSRFSKGLLDKKLPFIGFPEDGRTRGPPASEDLDSEEDDRSPRRS